MPASKGKYHRRISQWYLRHKFKEDFHNTFFVSLDHIDWVIDFGGFSVGQSHSDAHSKGIAVIPESRCRRSHDLMKQSDGTISKPNGPGDKLGLVRLPVGTTVRAEDSRRLPAQRASGSNSHGQRPWKTKKKIRKAQRADSSNYHKGQTAGK